MTPILANSRHVVTNTMLLNVLNYFSTKKNDSGVVKMSSELLVFRNRIERMLSYPRPRKFLLSVIRASLIRRLTLKIVKFRTTKKGNYEECETMHRLDPKFERFLGKKIHPRDLLLNGARLDSKFTIACISTDKTNYPSRRKRRGRIMREVVITELKFTDHNRGILSEVRKVVPAIAVADTSVLYKKGYHDSKRQVKTRPGHLNLPNEEYIYLFIYLFDLRS